MEKRLPLALFLSLLVFSGWALLNPRPKPPEEPAPAQATPAGDEPLAEPSTGAGLEPPPVLVPSLAAEEEVREIRTFGRPGEPGYYRAEFSNRGGRLVRLQLGDFFTRVGLDDAQKADPEYWLTLLEPIVTEAGTTGSLLLDTRPSSEDYAPGGLLDALWRMEEIADGGMPGVRFTYGPGTGLVFVKEIRFEPGTWHVLVRLTLRNESLEAGGKKAEFRIRPAGCVPAELNDSFYPEPRAVAIGRASDEADWEIAWKEPRSLKSGESGPLDVPSPVAAGGMHNKYFAVLLRGSDGPSQRSLSGAGYTVVERLEPRPDRPPKIAAGDLYLSLKIPERGRAETWGYTVYAGPKAPEALEKDFDAHAALIDKDLGTFFCGASLIAAIGHGLLAVLGFFHAILGNWGIAIILLTICVRGVLFPLNRRSQTAMARYQKKMKRVQPKIEEAKKRFANDPQKQREAQAKIMQEEGAFPPLGGCAPMFLQIPVFFGLFSALRTSFDLRQAPFAFWIDDLSRPDRLLELDLSIPLLVTNLHLQYLNVLPILMVVMWIWQQKGMPAPADEQAARMQKMMMFMPVVFGFMLYGYAAGLSLYMITQSTLGIVEQKLIKKVWPIDDTEVEKKGPGGCGPFSGVMQNLAEKQKEQMKRMEAAKHSQRPATKAKRKKRR